MSGASAADLKFLHRMRQTRSGTSNRSLALHSISLSVPPLPPKVVRECAAMVHERRKRGTDDRVADSTGNWVDTLAPSWARPYLRLARADRPIGAWLLLLPCWWSAGLAAIGAGRPYPDLWHVFLFFVGAFVMRGAGCTWNDIVDRDLDAMVARTRSRPIPSGQVSVKAAAVFLVLQALVGLLVLIQFNAFTILTGVASLGIIAIYPLMKRITWWPQVVL